MLRLVGISSNPVLQNIELIGNQVNCNPIVRFQYEAATVTRITYECNFQNKPLSTNKSYVYFPYFENQKSAYERYITIWIHYYLYIHNHTDKHKILCRIEINEYFGAIVPQGVWRIIIDVHYNSVQNVSTVN